VVLGVGFYTQKLSVPSKALLYSSVRGAARAGEISCVKNFSQKIFLKRTPVNEMLDQKRASVNEMLEIVQVQLGRGAPPSVHN
jgi:hypothetical protein